MKFPILTCTTLALTAASSYAATQSTIVRAPITVVAIGPSSATVDVNVNDGKRKHTVVVRKPVTALSTPLRSMHVRIN